MQNDNIPVKRIKNYKRLIVSSLCLLISISTSLMADEILVATASNFSEPLKVIAKQFEKTSNHKVTIISGSTGKLYAQIKHGAPFDIFFFR